MFHRNRRVRAPKTHRTIYRKCSYCPERFSIGLAGAVAAGTHEAQCAHKNFH